MSYTLLNINLKNTKDASWRSIKISDDDVAHKQHGQLFCMAELTKADDEKIETIEGLMEFVMTLFTEQDSFTSTRSEDLLEHMLEETNREFTQMTEDMESGAFTDLSIIIGIIKHDNLVISSHGKLSAWLLHPFAKKGNEVRYRWVDILENSKKNEESASGKLFDQVVAGELAEQQSFIIGTKNVWQIFTQDKFKELVLGTKAKRLKQIIIKTVGDLPTRTDMAVLVGKNESKNSVMADTADIDEDADESLTEEYASQKEEKHKALANLFGVSKNTQDNKTGDSKRVPALKQEAKKLEQHSGSIATHVEKKIVSGKNWFTRLSGKAKFLFVVAVVLLVAAVQSFSWINSQNQEEKISVQFDEKLAIIKDKQDEAEAKLIYNDKVSARELIQEALGLTYDLPDRYEQEEAQKKELAAELEKTLQEIDGLETLSGLSNVFTFPAETSLTAVHELIPLRAGTMLVVTNQPVLQLIDLSAQSSHEIPLENVTDTLVDTAYDKESATLYALTKSNTILKVALSSIDSSTSAIEAETLDFSIADIGDPSVITFYANKLYAVDPADQQVKKLDLANNSVTNWLANSQAGLGATIDAAIDGNIYLAMQTEVRQYFRGEPTGWAITGLTPLPATIVAMHAELDGQFIYLLDTTTSRLIVLNQDGSLVKQFTSPQLISPAQLYVNEQGRELYILDGKTIFRIPITWLNE